MQNYKLESGQRGEERQKNNQDKLWVFGRHLPSLPPQQSSQKIVFVSTLVNAISPSALRVY